MADKAKGNLALIFGGGADDGAAPGGSSGDGYSGDTDDAGGERAEHGDDDEAELAPPADFAVHAAEAFPEMAGDDARIEALYRTIQACHPRM